MLKHQDNFNIKFTIRSTIDAIKWFKDKIKSAFGANPKISDTLEETEVLSEQEKEKNILDEDNDVSKFEIGKMYLFHYDPKTKVKLPYYDTFPLIIMVGLAPGGFTGINFHYLPIKMRMLLLSNLLSISILKDGELERLRISYDILKSVSTLESFKPCFKRYLYDHVRGTIKGIPPSDWGYAAALPFENFKKKSKQEVWKDSMDSLN